MHLKKSKIISLLSIIIFLISVIYAASTLKQGMTSKYKANTKEITGIVLKCQSKDNYTKVILKGKEKILVNDYSNSKCILGSKIKAGGSLEKISNLHNFNLFDYQKYLYSQKINYMMKTNKIIIINKNTSFLYKLKNSIKSKIETYKSADYLNTFILGDSKNIDEKVINSYRNNGISHILAISGMHITLLATAMLFLLNKLFTRKIINYFIVIIILSLYVFLTSFSPSVVRATTLFIILTVKQFLNLKINTIYILIFICSLFLFYNPFVIYNIGFLLTFIISFYLILFSKYLKNYQNYFHKTFIVSLISFLTSAPIIINNYHALNFLSPVINIIFVPIISLIIYPLSLLALFITPLDGLLIKLIKPVENLSILISKINYFNLSFSHINFFFIIVYYLIITYSIYSILTNKKNKLIILIILMIFHYNINIFNSSVQITALDVGQGDSILIKFPHNKSNILLDTGGLIISPNYTLTKSITIPYLKSSGIKIVDYLILTHGDYDHMGEAINLVNNFKVEKVIFNCGPYNDLEKELIKVLDKKKIKYYSCISELNIGNKKLSFLQTKEYDNENDNSNVIYTELDGYKFMFMGDASSTTEKEIINKYNLPDIDVLKVGHHGSKTSSSEEFIKEMNPKYSIISVGKNNRYGHPNKEVLKNLKGSKIYRTDQNGSIMFKIKNNKLKIEKCNHTYKYIWYNNYRSVIYMKNKHILILVVVLCLLVFTGCNRNDKTKLRDGVDYKINGEFTGKYLDISKRGYYIDTLNQPNAPYLYIICMGQKNTGGYSLKIKEVNSIDGKTEIIVEEITPDKGDMVTMAITNPTIIVEFSKYQENIIIKNTEGQIFEKLN